MTGKEKCSLLKKIRRKIAKKNKIPFEMEECNAKGPCPGYCPKCDEEVQQLEKALQEKEAKKEKKTKKIKKSKIPKSSNKKQALHEGNDRLSQINQAIARYEERYKEIQAEKQSLEARMEEIRSFAQNETDAEKLRVYEIQMEQLFAQLQTNNAMLQVCQQELGYMLDEKAREEFRGSRTMGIIAAPSSDNEEELKLLLQLEELNRNTSNQKKLSTENKPTQRDNIYTGDPFTSIGLVESPLKSFTEDDLSKMLNPFAEIKANEKDTSIETKEDDTK